MNLQPPIPVRHALVYAMCACMVMLASTLWAGPSSGGGPEGQSAGPGKAELAQFGERMYREGILPSGAPMQALIKGDITVDGTAFTCVSCHLRSGLGSSEGGIVTPPTNGDKLFHPVKAYYKGFEIISSVPRRPAYTDRTLADVIQGGVDPTGREIDEVMPRYHMDDTSMAILIDYLRGLSSGPTPWHTDNTLSFATVISEGVKPEDRDAMLAPLEAYIKLKNDQAAIYESDGKQARMAEAMVRSRETPYLRLSLAKWVLKGPPETWRGQLDEYSRKGPVLALLGGMVVGDWRPVHEFCEENRIPCVFPVTDFPVISDTDWYTLYISKGYYQEGESAARYLGGLDGRQVDGKVLQIVGASRTGRALSEGFEKTWDGMGNKKPVTIKLKEGETLTAKALGRLMEKERPSILVLWTGPESLPALDAVAAGKNRPEAAVVSYGALGKDLWSLKEDVRDFTYITYPYRLPQDEARLRFYIPGVGVPSLKGDCNNIMKRAYSVTTVLTATLMDMRGNYYRDNFLDLTGMMMDVEAPLYVRLSFGPGQRYAVKGCYIVQLTKGPSPSLVKMGDWVIH